MNHLIRNRFIIINSLVLLFCYFFFRRSMILVSPLDADEILTWNIVQESWQFLFSAVYTDNQQPLYYVFLKICNYFVPFHNDVWLRYPSLLISILTVLMINIFTLKSFRPIISLLICLFLIYQPLFRFLSVYARPYGLLIFLISLNLISLINVFFRHKTKIYKDIFLISLLLMCLTHYLTYFYLLALLITFLVLKVRLPIKDFGRARIITFLSLLSLHIIGACFQLAPLAHRENILLDYPFQDSLLRAFTFSPYLHPLHWWSFALLGLVFIFRTFRQKSKVFGEVFFLFLLPLVGIGIFSVYSAIHMELFIDRYVVIFLPSYLFFMAHFFQYWLNNSEKITLALSLGLVIVFLSQRQAVEEFDWKSSPKKMMREIKAAEFLKEDSLVLCNTIHHYKKIFTKYSTFYFFRDICTQYRYWVTQEIASDFDFILYSASTYEDPLLKKSLQNYEVIYNEENFTLYKRR